MRRGIIVLAAGLSRRMGGPNKLLQTYRGRPLAAWALDCAAQVSARQRIVVLGRDAAAIRDLAPPEFTAIVNPNPDEGIASSLKLGLAALDAVDAAAIMLADMPGITPALLDALFAEVEYAYAAVPRRGEDWGNPVVLSAAAIADAATLAGDAGARRLLKARADQLAILETADPAIFHDLDTASDFTC